MSDGPHALTWTNLTEMKLHSSEAADLDRSCMLHVFMFIITQLIHSLYIVFSHITTFKDRDSSYFCPRGFVVDPVLINHVMLHIKVARSSVF